MGHSDVIDKKNISFLYRGWVLAFSKSNFKLRGRKELGTWLSVGLLRKVPASPGLNPKLSLASIAQQFCQIGIIHVTLLVALVQLGR